MTAFEKMIEDVFNVPEFIQTFTDVQTGSDVVTICYQTETKQLYTQFGIDTGVSFYLTCKTGDYSPKKGNKITFRGETYRVDSYFADSFNLTYNIYLRALTSK